MNPLASFGGGFSDSGSAVASTGSKHTIGGLTFARKASMAEKLMYGAVAASAVAGVLILARK